MANTTVRTDLGDGSFAVTPKIQSINDGAKFAKDFLTNPPSDPVQAIKVMGSAINVGGAISAGLTAVFPFTGPILPVLGGIFDLFGGGGPSIGEVTLNAIAQVSQQIEVGFKAVTETIEQTAKEQASRTIDTVLSGVDDLSRQQSAVSVFQNFAAQGILADQENQKNQIFADYMADINTARQQYADEVTAAIQKAQAESNAQYKLMQTQIYGMVGDVLGPINAQLQAAAAEADELLDIQRQIDEIVDFMAKGQHDSLAKTIIIQYTGEKL